MSRRIPLFFGLMVAGGCLLMGHCSTTATNAACSSHPSDGTNQRAAAGIHNPEHLHLWGKQCGSPSGKACQAVCKGRKRGRKERGSKETFGPASQAVRRPGTKATKRAG